MGLCGDNGEENKTQTIMGYIGLELTGVPEKTMSKFIGDHLKIPSICGS